MLIFCIKRVYIVRKMKICKRHQIAQFNNFHSVGSGVRERFQDNFGALISKLLPDSPDVVKFLRYLIFLIYAIVVF